MARPKTKAPKNVETLTHSSETRAHIPTAEYQSVMREEDQAPISVAYKRRNRDLDPQLVWRGKDVQDWSDLVVQAPPLYIQEKVHPKVLIDDLMRRTREREDEEDEQIDLFADFDGVPDGEAKTEFYQHEANWTNRMILGDSLQVMASLAEREGLRGKVQCIYLDPPYGIKFNSNFQWSTTSRDVKDGKAEHITREPEQVKAFRDTWRDGIHSYLTYLRDRLLVCRDLLTESGSIFVQIGDENVHRVRALMDEVFGEDNFLSEIFFQKTGGQRTTLLANVGDILLWYARDSSRVKYRDLFQRKDEEWSKGSGYSNYFNKLTGGTESEPSTEGVVSDSMFQATSMTSQNPGAKFEVAFRGRIFKPSKTQWWKTDPDRFARLIRASRIVQSGNTLRYVRYVGDFPVYPRHSLWTDTGGSVGADKTYVVQTAVKVIERCILMTTDPGDLILDPTCGSGTTAAVAEQWGRRWITIDTSRVALALARARLMGARYPFYLLKNSREGQFKLAEIMRKAPSQAPTTGNVRHGFVYERAPHIMLSDIANNAEIDVIWERFQEQMEPLREGINGRLAKHPSALAREQAPLEEWQMPREPGTPWPEKAQEQHERFMRVTTDATKQKAVDKINKILERNYTIETLPEHPVDLWENEELIELHRQWWELRIARQQEIDASIAANADFEYLYDKPYEDKKKVRVAGPFTVESLSPHRTLGVDEHGDVMDTVADAREGYGGQDFPSMILETLRRSGIQQAHKEDRIAFDALTPWPGRLVCAVGTYTEGETGQQKKAGLLVGPEFGSVSRPDLVQAAREAGDAGFDALIACAFNFDAHATEFEKLGRLTVLKARMNADLHMAADLANTGAGNLFVLFGEPDLDVLDAGEGLIQVRINGVDVFHPNTGEVRSDGADGIACWFVDTDYNEESFFVRQAYFLGAGDPYKSLKTTLKAEIDEEAWATLYSDTSRPFAPPASGRIAVKVINHLGDEVMKVFRVDR